MGLKIIVLAKQVPDTRNVGKDAMTAEGTVNRAALPAIFNPESWIYSWNTDHGPSTCSRDYPSGTLPRS